MSRFKGEYLRVINRLDKKKERLRKENEKEVKQLIKHRALMVGVDLINTQHSLSPRNISYHEELSRKKFQAFQDFINYLSDEHRIDFYFEIENGKFTWLL